MATASANPHLITFYETSYWATGDYPTKEQVQSLFKFSNEEYKEQLKLLSAPLGNRGLPTDCFQKDSPVRKPRGVDLLDPVFVLAVGFIVDTVDKRTTTAKLKACGMSTAQWKAHLKKPDHRKYFEDRLNDSFSQDVENSAKLSIARNVEAGDLQTIKYFHEYTGRYRPDSQNTILNIGVLLGRIMEILSQHLDSEALSKVADEFDQVMIESTARELSA